MKRPKPRQAKSMLIHLCIFQKDDKHVCVDHWSLWGSPSLWHICNVDHTKSTDDFPNFENCLKEHKECVEYVEWKTRGGFHISSSCPHHFLTFFVARCSYRWSLGRTSHLCKHPKDDSLGVLPNRLDVTNDAPGEILGTTMGSRDNSSHRFC